MPSVHKKYCLCIHTNFMKHPKWNLLHLKEIKMVLWIHLVTFPVTVEPGSPKASSTNCNLVLPCDMADTSNRRASQTCWASESHRKCIARTLIPKEKDKEINILNKKESTEDRSQELTQRFPKDTKKRVRN